MSGAFETAASWLEEGTPEARALGEEIFEFLDGLSPDLLVLALEEMAVMLEAGCLE